MTTRAGEVIRQRNAEIGNPATIEGAMGSDGAVAGALGAVMPAAVTGNADETLSYALAALVRQFKTQTDSVSKQEIRVPPLLTGTLQMYLWGVPIFVGQLLWNALLRDGQRLQHASSNAARSPEVPHCCEQLRFRPPYAASRSDTDARGGSGENCERLARILIERASSPELYATDRPQPRR
jgi:hypothetical protein